MPTTTMPAATFHSPTRVMTSLLSASERRALIWLAHRMPAWVTPDHLTGLALVAMVGAGAAFWLASVTPVGLLLVVVCLAVNWFGDSLDGTLARVRHQERPRYGHYVDHVVDVAGTACLLGGMALSGHMTPVIALAVLAAYLMVTAEAFLATHARGVFTMSHFGVGPTELRILLAAGAMGLITHPKVRLFGEAVLLFNVGGVIAVAGLLVTFVRAALTNGRALY
ncbi:MAG: CDP-alcohol phosphatidyltransferase family protein, partial [Vicinamibacterales bacterium]